MNSGTPESFGINRADTGKPSYRRPVLAAAISVALALIVFGPHLFDPSMPYSEDVRAHVFKIDFLHAHLSQGSWPTWNPYWYEGLPANQGYPVGFYLLGALVTFISGSAVVSYKLLTFLTMVSNGLAIYYFARKFLRMNYFLAITSLIAYESSTALLVNYMYGSIPNLLGWTVCVVFFTSYFGNLFSGSTRDARRVLVPGLLLGITALIHPFPAIFGVLAVLAGHVVLAAHNGLDRQVFKINLRYFVLVLAVGALVSSYYWIPVLLTRDYVSPIYTSLTGAWPGGVLFVVLLVLLALTTALIAHRMLSDDARLDLLVVLVILAAALGFGATRLAPFGLGAVLHEFRFATIVLPSFCILLIGHSFDTVAERLKRGSAILVVPGVCLVLVTSVMPLVTTFNSDHLGRLVKRVDEYEKADYAALLGSIDMGRLVVPINRGGLLEGDGPVTFGWRYGVETTNGPYNQGDPKFFKYTVHLEWDERWLGYEYTRENLMQEGAAKYLFIRKGKRVFPDTHGLGTVTRNSYGTLLALEQPVARAVNVSPVLLDVRDSERVTEFFNILLPQGYRMVFVTADSIDRKHETKFQYVMVDDPAKAKQYKGKVVLLLEDGDQGVSVADQGDQVIRLNLPWQTYTEDFFYRGDRGDVSAWSSFIFGGGHQLSASATALLQTAADDMRAILQQLEYQPAEYEASKTSIALTSEPGFTLVKDSYFPYWHTDQGVVMDTSQGFMLVYSDSNRITLNYEETPAYRIAGAGSVAGTASILFVLVIAALRRTKSNR